MDLIDLYNNIENPLDDEAVLFKIVEDYSKSNEGLGGFYSKLTTNVEKQNPKKYYKQDGDLFHSTMFNLWKKSILEMNQETFLDLRDEGYLENDFIAFRKYLKTVPDLSTEAEVNKFYFSNDAYSEEINKYRWNNFAQDPTWQHVSSRYVTAHQQDKINVEHRLYLNMELADTYKMAYLLVSKCSDKKLPYYFKFDRMGTRDDSIVIYSDTENLSNYIEVLNEIKQEHPELVSRFQKAPLLTGRIDGYIGYGSEPLEKRTSYTKKRAEMIETIMDEETKKWVKDNQDLEIRYKGTQIPFKTYLSKKVTANFVQKLKKDFEHKASFSSNEEAIKKCGYSLEDLYSQQLQSGLERIITMKINQGLTNYCDNDEFDDVEIEVRDGKTIKLTSSMLDKTVKELSIQMAKHDSNYVKNIRKRIDEESDKQGIDTKTFCFDDSVKNKILNQRRNKESKTTEELNRMLSENTNSQIKNNMHK